MCSKCGNDHPEQPAAQQTPHSHTHTHHHQHHNGNYANANKDHFDTTAHEYDDMPGAQQLCYDLAQILLKNYNFDPASTEVMEFACGTGLVSQHIAPHSKSLLGVDISQAMVNQFQKKAEKGSGNMRAAVVELKGVEGELDGAKFDVIICCSAYHHFASIDDTTRMLTYFLKPGGVLLVTDLLEFTAKASKGLDSYEHIVPHIRGFKEQIIVDTFQRAGLQGVSVKFAMEAPKTMFGRASKDLEGVEVNIFIAKGTKSV